MSPALREAFKFHHEHGGTVAGQKAIFAARAARAEVALRAAVEAGDARVRWEEDDDFDIAGSTDVPEIAAEWAEKLGNGTWEARGCILEVRHPACALCKSPERWEEVAAVWGVVGPFDASDTYPRTLEADLALEADFGMPLGRHFPLPCTEPRHNAARLLCGALDLNDRGDRRGVEGQIRAAIRTLGIDDDEAIGTTYAEKRAALPYVGGGQS